MKNNTEGNRKKRPRNTQLYKVVDIHPRKFQCNYGQKVTRLGSKKCCDEKSIEPSFALASLKGTYHMHQDLKVCMHIHQNSG